MKTTTDHPGIYFPPPIIFILLFILSIILQKRIPLPTTLWESKLSPLAGIMFIAISFLVLIPAMLRFLKTKNTLITVKPANSLQATGIYSVSRNPMYLALLMLYIGVAFLTGNMWTFLLIPVLLFAINKFVIIKEEQYLERRFGIEYTEYCKDVRRWI